MDPNHEFVEPTKLVKTPDDVKKWERSEAYAVCLEHSM